MQDAAKLCKDYAAKMAQPDQTWIQSEPAEWDFREVTEAELPVALEYERKREDAGFRQRACGWLDSTAKGQTMRERLLDAGEAAFDAAALADAGAWHKLFPCECGLTRLERLWLVAFPLFPLPWIAFEPAERVETAKDFGWRPPPFRPVPVTAGNAPQLVGWHAFKVDFGAVKVADAVAAFEKWARGEAREHKRQSGKASAPTWHELRELAAYRLDKAGLAFERKGSPVAKPFLARHRKQCAAPDAFEVLPDYSDRAAWFKAVKAAKQRLRAV